MENSQTLGGTRESRPLDKEMAFPLTTEEFETLKDNLIVDKFTNWESFLLTTFITTLISVLVICFTTSFVKNTIIDNVAKFEINYTQIIIVIIYSGVSFGSFVGFLIARFAKKKSRKAIHRLQDKISNYFKDTKSHE
jgi:hypothetical protein